MLFVAVIFLAILQGGEAKSLLLKDFTWTDCGQQNSVFKVTSLNVTSPLRIPGQLRVTEAVASLTAPLPADAVVKFTLKSTSFAGDAYPNTFPCFPNQGGSCGYRLCELLGLTSTSSSVTRQVVTAMTSAGSNVTCPPVPQTLSLHDFTIDIPSMLHTDMDLFTNTNNYFVTVQLLSGDLKQEFGCVKLTMPVVKPCQGWLCMRDIDFITKLMNP